MNLQLSIAMDNNPLASAIFDGKVKPDGIDLICTPLHASELFWRQLRFGDFDLSEMSMSSLMMAVAGGDERWVGIPVFTTRRMVPFGILVRKDRNIDTPAQTSRARRLACRSISRRPRSGHTASCSMNTTSIRAIWNSGWSATTITVKVL